MKAKDLRIGNYIWFNDAPQKDGFAKVLNMYDDQIFTSQGTAYINECAPIPLTEQWLKDFGFKYIYFDHGYGNKYRFNGIEIHIIENEIRFYYITNRLFTVYEYVHELQNLYHSLTGKELKLNPVQTT